jgi:hypothetical protein
MMDMSMRMADGTMVAMRTVNTCGKRCRYDRVGTCRSNAPAP